MSAHKRKFTSGYCARLELENFKSWKGKQSIGPFTNGFTAIIGSNGAGKSNLMDAISFVTGVKARKLRGDQLRDLIFEGDKKGEDEDRHMSVTMVYSCGKNEVPGKREGEEIIFTRTVSASSAGSTYRLANRVVTYDEYNEMLSKLNILVEARNFLIFQGDVEATASKSPQDLSLFFEQVSGSDVYRDEYEQCLAKKKELEALAFEKNRQVMAAKAEKKEAKLAKEDMDRYNELVQEREDLRVEFALFQIRGAETAVSDARTQVDAAKSAVVEAEQVEKKMEQERKQAQTELSKKAREQSKAEEAASEAAKKTSTLNASLGRKTEAKKRETSKLKEAQAQLKKANETLAKHKEDMAQLQKEIDDLEGKQLSLNASFQAVEGEEEEETAELTKEQMAQLEKLSEEADKSNAELRTEEMRLNRELEPCKDRLVTAKSNRDQLESRLKQTQADKEELIRKRDRAKETLSKREAEMEKFQADVKTREAQMNTLISEIEEKKKRLEQAKQTLSASKARNQDFRRTKKLEETVAALKRNIEGVKGRLVELVVPTSNKYSMAVDTALGKHMDAIVVTTEAVALDCIKFLRDQRLGQATFLPLDRIEPKPISETKRREVGPNRPYRFCIDVLRYDSSLERAVKFAAADAMICDTLEDARTLCFRKNIRVKAVTLEGHLISARGDMTGGALEGRVDRFAETELAKAREEKDRLEKEVVEMETKLDQLRVQASRPDSRQSTQSLIQLTKKDLEANTTKLQEIESRLKSDLAAFEKSRAQVDELQNEIALLSKRLEELRDQMAKKEDQLFSKVPGIKGNARELARRAEELNRVKREQLESIRNQLLKLRGQFDFLSSSTEKREKDVQTSEVAVKQHQEQMTKLEEELQELKGKVEEAEKVQKETEKEQERVRRELEVVQSRVNDLQKRLDDASKERGAAARRVAQSESDYQRARASKVDIVKQAVLEGLNLPRVGEEGTGDEEKEEDDQRDLDELIKNAADTQFDLNVLSKPSCQTAKEYAERLEELKVEAEKLAPDQRADAHFQEASNKLKGIDASVAEAREATEAAVKAFETVEKLRRDRFVDMFTHVMSRIDGIYRELTKRPSAPLGGSAILSAVDKENPFLGGIKFECKPPNKQFRPMEQLSGGEKTIAALALLFAIHSYRPSPFFVLDEVDAALDNDNVERVSNYIVMRSRLDQQQEQMPQDDDNDEEDNGGDESEDSDERTERKRRRLSKSRGDKRRFQSLVISLKDAFFCKAESLVGVYKDNQVGSSKCLTLDLSVYKASN